MLTSCSFLFLERAENQTEQTSCSDFLLKQTCMLGRKRQAGMEKIAEQTSGLWKKALSMEAYMLSCWRQSNRSCTHTAIARTPWAGCVLQCTAMEPVTEKTSMYDTYHPPHPTPGGSEQATPPVSMPCCWELGGKQEGLTFKCGMGGCTLFITQVEDCPSNLSSFLGFHILPRPGSCRQIISVLFVLGAWHGMNCKGQLPKSCCALSACPSLNASFRPSPSNSPTRRRARAWKLTRQAGQYGPAGGFLSHWAFHWQKRAQGHGVAKQAKTLPSNPST